MLFEDQQRPSCWLLALLCLSQIIESNHEKTMRGLSAGVEKANSLLIQLAEVTSANPHKKPESPCLLILSMGGSSQFILFPILIFGSNHGKIRYSNCIFFRDCKVGDGD